MATICPAILAESTEEYEKQIGRVAQFATRIQIDLADGIFAKTKTVSPQQAWWPAGTQADIHLMYRDPKSALGAVLRHEPHLLIVHAESNSDIHQLAGDCRHHGVFFGMALLAGTPVDAVKPYLDVIDHVLVFSGSLGSFGGHADLELLSKVRDLINLKPGLEIGWDGGINDQTVSRLVSGGVDILNVGGFIQNSDNPRQAWQVLVRIAEETGST